MRFHLGVSFRPKDVFKWVVLVFGGLFAFFSVGTLKQAHALSEYNPQNVYVTTTKQSYYRCDRPTYNCTFVTDLSDSYVQNSTSLPWSATLRGAVPTSIGYEAYAIRYLQIPVFNNVSGATIPANSYVTATFEFSNLAAFTKGVNFNLVGLALRNTSDSWTYGNQGQQFSCNGDVCVLTYNSGSSPTRGFMLSFGIISNTDNLNRFFLLNTNYNVNQVITLKSVSVKYDNSSEDISNSINNQTTIINNQLGDIKDNMNNNFKNVIDNTSEIKDTIIDDSISLDKGNNFFNNFNDNDFGLSGIVSSPLVMIRGLTSGASCDPLTFDILGKSVSMPSGCILWDKVPSNIEIIYFIFIGGFLAYRLVTKLFHDINDLKNPEKSEVSTLDL